MARFSVGLFVAFAVWVSTTPVLSQGTGSGLISQTAARRLGLHRAWFTQAEINHSQDRVVGMVLHQPAPKIDPDAPEGAELPPIEPATLYVQSRRGVLQAIHAETGRTLWIRQVGRRNHISELPAANNEFVAVINGQILFLLDRRNGNFIWEHKLDVVPIAAPAIGEEWVYVPTVSGRLRAHSLKDPTDYWNYGSEGPIRVQPLVIGNRIVWATDRGYLYVGDNREAAIDYRLETKKRIVAPATHFGVQAFVASRDGYVYALELFSGVKSWRFSVGDPVSHSPIALNGRVYAISELGGMFSLSAKVGLKKWWSPNVGKFLASSSKRLYVADHRGGRMLVLDAESGARLNSLSMPRLDIRYINTQTDRIYLASSRGLVQCLREFDLTEPLIHALSTRPIVKPEVEDNGPGSGAGANPFGQ